MTLSLTLPERIGAIILFAEVKIGNRAFLGFIKDARTAVELKEEEIKEYGIKGRPDGWLDWAKSTQDNEKEFTITDGAYNFMKTRLEDLDKQGKMAMDLLPLANKILGDSEKNG